MKRIIPFVLIALITQLTIGQDKDAVLLTIDSNEVTVGEFLRIYNKNKDINIEEEKGIDEYLDLFVNYKLKVVEAENLGYDQHDDFLKEIAQYRDQLITPYLENDEIEEFVKEAYDRLQHELNVSHILVSLSKNPSPDDTLKAFEKAMKIRARLKAGEPFDEVAKATSDDPSAKVNAGNLGWFSVFQMIYPFESAAYGLTKSEISMPVRTSYGYHILKLNDKRKNRGEIKVAHIMTLLSKTTNELEKEAAKQKIEKAYSELQSDSTWQNVVSKYSEHKPSKVKDGMLGWVRSGVVPDDFIEVCYTTDSGSYSEPFETEYGYHIVKVHGTKDIPPFEDIESKYESKIRSGGERKKLSQQNILKNIKEEYGYTFYDDQFNSIYNLLDSASLFGKNWNDSIIKINDKPIFKIGDKEVMLSHYTAYLSKKKMNKKEPYEDNIAKFRDDYIFETVYEYGKSQLPEKHEDLRNLLQEYHDGILLFNLTEDKVWKKAIEDTVGLEKFYAENKENYKWKERVQICKYTYKDASNKEKILKKAKKRMKKDMTKEEFSAMVCPSDTVPCVDFTILKYQKGENAVADSINWDKGANLETKDGEDYVLYYVEAVLPEQSKKLSEARGVFTANYQTFLEEQWIADMKEKYNITVNQDVLDELKKTQE